MTEPISISFIADDKDSVSEITSKISVVMDADGKMNPLTRKVNSLMRGALKRLAESERWEKLDSGEAVEMPMPERMQAPSVQVVKLARNATHGDSRDAGAAMAAFAGGQDCTLLLSSHPKSVTITEGAALRSYAFCVHKSAKADAPGGLTVMVSDPDTTRSAAAGPLAVAAGVLFTRDLVNEPANVLTTTEFAKRLLAMRDLGLEVEVLDEPELEKLGMGSLLSVGQGSASPSKVAVMRWNGGGDEAPFALVGKGVVFDTGGISLKPAAGMEDMTMDMGGAAVVSGVMRALALRKARANVVGVVGLVENMPDGMATRPGDIVTSMKGDTIEVINTDAEGRLVLADILWYTQEKYAPKGMVDLATLTGAIMVALGHHTAGVFSNDDALCKGFLKAADATGEAAWRMPLGKAYDKKIDCKFADMKNTGGRMAGSITAAQFLQRFVKPDTPWIHLDIAGVAAPGPTKLSPKGATGWGVRALDRLIAEQFEG